MIAGVEVDVVLVDASPLVVTQAEVVAAAVVLSVARMDTSLESAQMLASAADQEVTPIKKVLDQVPFSNPDCCFRHPIKVL